MKYFNTVMYGINTPDSEEEVRRYRIDWRNGLRCVTTTVDAKNEDEALLMVETCRYGYDREEFLKFKKELSEEWLHLDLKERLKQFKKTASIKIVDDFIKDIPDAETLLYEMDANNVDEIVIKGGYEKSKTYTREEVRKYLDLSYERWTGSWVRAKAHALAFNNKEENMEKIKPCPFCGGRAILAPNKPGIEDDDYYRVICTDCKTSTRLDYDSEVIRYWNKRK